MLTFSGAFFRMPEKTTSSFHVTKSSSSDCLPPNLANTDGADLLPLSIVATVDTRIVFDGSVALELDEIIIDGLSITVRFTRLKMSFFASLSA